MKDVDFWKKGTIVLGITAVLLFIAITYKFNVEAKQEDIYSRNEPISQNFAQCLSEQGVKFYGSDWCPHCKNQKEIFGEDWKFFNGYVECESEKELCQSKRITGYPTWEINNAFYQGEKSLKDLSKMTGCRLNP